MKNALIIYFIQILFSTINYAMEPQDPLSIAEDSNKCFDRIYQKIQNCTESNYEDASSPRENEQGEVFSCAYEFGRCQKWPTLCVDDEPGELLKVPFIASGISSGFLLSFGALIQNKVLFICGASLSPGILCSAFACAGCCAATCAKRLDKAKFLGQFDDGKRAGFKDTACRKCVDTNCSNLHEILKRASEPCFGESSR